MVAKRVSLGLHVLFFCSAPIALSGDSSGCSALAAQGEDDGAGHSLLQAAKQVQSDTASFVAGAAPKQVNTTTTPPSMDIAKELSDLTGQVNAVTDLFDATLHDVAAAKEQLVAASNMKDRFDELQAKVRTVRDELAAYHEREAGKPKTMPSLGVADAPERLRAIKQDLEALNTTMGSHEDWEKQELLDQATYVQGVDAAVGSLTGALSKLDGHISEQAPEDQASQEARCEDKQPPKAWENDTCEKQAKAGKCENRLAGKNKDGYCAKTCGVCSEAAAAAALQRASSAGSKLLSTGGVLASMGGLSSALRELIAYHNTKVMNEQLQR